MDDREGLLRAIRDQPEEDAPRLIYADWLDEHGTTDQDAARAEYIRLSCGVGYGGDRMRTKVRLGVNEGKWLDANWKRLVPNLVACATPELWVKRLPEMERGLVDHVAGGVKSRRSGRNLTVRLFWGWDSGRKEVASRYSGLTTHLWFWRGFLRTFDVYAMRQLYLVGDILAADDPLAEPKIMNPPLEHVWNADRTLHHCNVRAHAAGPLFQFVDGYTHYLPGQEGVGVEVKQFASHGHDAEPTYRRTCESISRAAIKWMRLNEGLSFHNYRSNSQTPQYKLVKLPLNAMEDYGNGVANFLEGVT